MTTDRIRPFIKWAGGKRWLCDSDAFQFPSFGGTYIEPFLGGGAAYFHLAPKKALISDANPKLIETYQVVRDKPSDLFLRLKWYERKHSKEFYYMERERLRRTPLNRAAQFLYLNRTCWNGLYRENRSGQFNVPMGSKQDILYADEDFVAIGRALEGAEIITADFESVISRSQPDDLIFVDPPYTVAHNLNGFVKYNQTIFSWKDQIRLRDALVQASSRGSKVVLTQADHESIEDLYQSIAAPRTISRNSKISGSLSGRRKTTEALYVF